MLNLETTASLPVCPLPNWALKHNMSLSDYRYFGSKAKKVPCSSGHLKKREKNNKNNK